MMKKIYTLYLPFILLISIMIVQSCSKDDNDDDKITEPVPEFEANNNTFADYTTWPVRSAIVGLDPAVGDAHGDNDSTVTRTVYVKDGQDFVNGTFPQGTIIVKSSINASGTFKEFTAMVKRGGNFNTENNGWEWFELTESGDIDTDGTGEPLRGGNLGNCTSCHKFAPTDYIFTTK